MKRVNALSAGVLLLAALITGVVVRQVHADTAEAMAFCTATYNPDGSIDFCNINSCPGNQLCLYQSVTIFGVFLEWCGCRVPIDTISDTSDSTAG